MVATVTYMSRTEVCGESSTGKRVLNVPNGCPCIAEHSTWSNCQALQSFDANVLKLLVRNYIHVSHQTLMHCTAYFSARASRCIDARIKSDVIELGSGRERAILPSTVVLRRSGCILRTQVTPPYRHTALIRL